MTAVASVIAAPLLVYLKLFTQAVNWSAPGLTVMTV